MNTATVCCKSPESVRAFTWMKWLVLLGLLGLLLLCWLFGWCKGEWNPNGTASVVAAPVAVPAVVSAPAPAPAPAPVAAPVVAPVAAPAPVLQSALLSAQLVDGKIKLLGTVATIDDKAKAFEAAKQAFGVDRVVDELQVKDGYKGIEWIELIGEAASQEDRAATEASARQAFAGFAGGNLRVDNRLVVKGPSPAMTPPASPGVPSTVPQASAPPGTCEIAMKAKLNFFTNSAVLTVSDKAKLKAMLACMKEGKYEVGGHTDNVGPDLRNQQLSEARAKVAMAYLVKRGVSAEFISATGYGMTKPLTGNDTIEGRRENRRVEVVRQ